MSNLNLQVLISTCNSRLSGALKVASRQAAGVSYIIVHQLFDGSSEQDYAEEYSAAAKRDDIEIITTYSKGLATSRNIALQSATSDILLFADDDIAYFEDSFLNVSKAFSQYPEADVITFQFIKSGGKPAKRYPHYAKARGLFSLFKVSSVEVAIRRRVVDILNITFDPRFGLGTDLPASEENIFLADIHRKGGKIFFYPENILEHPDETSGYSWTKNSTSSKGALFKRVFGWIGLPLLIVFFLKHFRKFDSGVQFVKAVAIAIKKFILFRR